MSVSKNILALYGGTKVRSTPFPPRRAFHDKHLIAVQEVFKRYEEKGIDFGYQGEFEERYAKAFVQFLGVDGYADAVDTGTGALFVAIASLSLEAGSEVLVSPISDPGTFNALVLNNLKPKLMDTSSMSYNVGVEQFVSRISDHTRAVILVHVTGRACPIEEIVTEAKKRNILVLEDCSHAHGARYRGRRVGTFGDVAAFSTMYRKNHGSGGCGGLVFTADLQRYQLVRAHADRGKPYWHEGYDDRNPNQFLFPALNFNQDEISCAIGEVSLSEVDETNRKRREFLHYFNKELHQHSQLCHSIDISDDDTPFFQPVHVETKKLTCTKLEFAQAIQAEGIPINPHYQYLAQHWPYLKPYLVDNFDCRNANEMLNKSFNLLFHEKFTKADADDIVRAIVKVESVLAT